MGDVYRTAGHLADRDSGANSKRFRQRRARWQKVLPGRLTRGDELVFQRVDEIAVLRVEHGETTMPTANLHGNQPVIVVRHALATGLAIVHVEFEGSDSALESLGDLCDGRHVRAHPGVEGEVENALLAEITGIPIDKVPDPLSRHSPDEGHDGRHSTEGGRSRCLLDGVGEGDFWYANGHATVEVRVDDAGKQLEPRSVDRLRGISGSTSFHDSGHTP